MGVWGLAPNNKLEILNICVYFQTVTVPMASNEFDSSDEEGEQEFDQTPFKVDWWV